MITSSDTHQCQANHLNCKEQQKQGEMNMKKNTKIKRIIFALIIILFAIATACLVQVRSGQAIVITRFGDPTRVLITPGLNWRLPIPFESTTAIDLRLRTTSSGLHDVGTKDGLRIIMQAYIIWQVEPNTESILQFLRAIPGNFDEEVTKQIRTFAGSALETTASGYKLENLVNTNINDIQLIDFESHLQKQLEQSLLKTYGIKIVKVGIERLTLPSVTLNATVERMKAERETIATERTAEGKQHAAEIRSQAEKEARIMVADANIRAAEINAQSIAEAAAIYGDAYAKSPELYTFLRSLDTLNNVINTNTRIILRTDSAPFKVLIDGPSTLFIPSKNNQGGENE